MLGGSRKNSTRQIIAICINYILHIYTSGKSLIVSVDDELILDFPVMKMTFHKDASRPIFLQKPDFYILNIMNNGINDVIQFVKTMQFNRGTKFILIGKDVNRQTLRNLASNFITRVLLLDPTTGTYSTFTPYKHRMLNNIHTKMDTFDFCTNHVKNITKLDTYSYSVNSDYRRQNEMFYDETPKVWTNSVISVLYYFSPPYTLCIKCENRGIEVEAHMIIMKLMNLTGRYHRRVIDVLDKRTANKLHRGKYDLLLNGYHFEGLDFTAPFVHDHYSWFVPSPVETPKWKYICVIFTSDTWVVLLFSMVLISVIWYFMDCFLKSQRPIYILHNLMVLMRLTVEEGFHFEIRHLHQLILNVSIYLLVFMVPLVYKTEYTTVLTKNIYEKDINSLVDAMKNGLYIGLPGFRKKLLEDSPKNVVYMKRFYVPCDFSTSCLEQAAKQRNMITATIDRYFNYAQRKFMDKDGKSVLKKLTPPLVDVQLVEVLRQGHVLTPTISKYLGDLRAHGFVNYLMAKYDHQAFVPPILPSSAIKLTFEHVQAPLIFLMIGVIAGTVVFLLELKFSRLESQSKN